MPALPRIMDEQALMPKVLRSILYELEGDAWSIELLRHRIETSSKQWDVEDQQRGRPLWT